ncbi:MAG: NADH-quinone oxidoreductase subunit M [Actinobacteria bacterium]|nr:NADH-quinone oxidoreductase subunit M [Actinomycetota bacterium]
MGFNILSLITFIPIGGMLIIALIPNRGGKSARWIALVTSLVILGLSIYLWLSFDGAQGAMQFEEKYRWIPGVNIYYHLGVDGISMPMVFLTCLLTVLGVLVSWDITHRPKVFHSLLLLLATGMLGVFVALDFILFYIFWELVLLPMYFLIAIWGSSNRMYAAIKFFIYTLLGSVLMLVGILMIFFNSGLKTFDILELTRAGIAPGLQNWIFFLLFMGFAIKVPMFPFHTWLPDAHTEAPTAGSVLLAGILLKMGSYGFIRISIPILPDAARAWAMPLAILAVIGIIYGALASLIQKDLKRLVAFSSVSHMGFVMLGISMLTPTAINGAVIQMFNHGCITGMLFLLVGMVYERTHSRMIADMGGLANKIPLWAGILAFTSFASLGLPGLSGFWGEFLVLFGTFNKGNTFARVMVYVSVLGIVLGAAYLLWMLQRVIFGKSSEKLGELKRLSWLEFITLAPLVVIIILIGVYPAPLLNIINLSVNYVLGM